ncbi:hypothetical protein [Geobacter benzoatilyticus]|uniref:Uncharacterized protein n=1 Tax=Geobacter benzoatilyticus TaxID=2815309 RepID=A0ABX7Q0S2_9BACT|nr:hypothetical protein [Geobacter benzoatilyticus]QSV44999.1 hypothetical protein JZM60_12685 [Geobacter benzoatilyticus]
MDTRIIRRKVISAISRHAGAMSREQIDKALETWDRAVKHDLMKSGGLTIDTTAADKRREEREREEAKLSTRGNDKETGRSFKIGYGNGRSLKYQIGNDGELIVTPDKPGIYTPNDYKAMLKAITRDIERRNRAMEKSKKTGTRWSRAPMLLQKPRTIASRQWEQPKPPKAKAEPPRVETKMQEQPQSVTQPPQAPLDSRGRYDLSRLNGHQIAAMRNGLDPMTPGVESMTAQQMKALAAEQAAASVAGLAERAGLAYVRDPRQRRW